MINEGEPRAAASRAGASPPRQRVPDPGRGEHGADNRQRDGDGLAASETSLNRDGTTVRMTHGRSGRSRISALAHARHPAAI